MSRIIKRYENRKLYDTANRKYVSLEEIAALIRAGVDVQIVDNTTGNDLTAQTLTQVIFEEGKKGRNPLSKEVLHEVIRWGNTVIDDSLQQVRQSLDSFMPQSLSRLLHRPNSEEIKELKERVASLEKLIQKLTEKGDTQSDLEQTT